MNKQVALNMLIERELKQQAREAALEDNRSLASWVRIAILEKLKRTITE